MSLTSTVNNIDDSVSPFSTTQECGNQQSIGSVESEKFIPWQSLLVFVRILRAQHSGKQLVYFFGWFFYDYFYLFFNPFYVTEDELV